MDTRTKADIVKNRVHIQSYFDAMIVPVMDFYYHDEIVNFEYNSVCKCPLHSESTASFKYFEYSNSFYCWGCTAGGDIINLHILNMKENQNEEISFEEAVDFLYSRFVEGNESTQLVFNVRKEKPLSTNVEVARFSNKLLEIENELINTTMDSSEKIDIYYEMDSLEQLVDYNKINATDARNKLLSIKKNLDSRKKIVKIEATSRVK